MTGSGITEPTGHISPTRHCMGSAVPELGQYDPSGQGSSTLPPVFGQYVPGLHVWHVDTDVAPTEEEYVPRGHFIGATKLTLSQ